MFYNKDKMLRVTEIIFSLKKEYPNSKTSLSFKSPLESLIATILSAQCTDKRVNIVTKDLFKKYKTWSHLANAKLEELQADIRGVNFHLGKAQRLIKAAQYVIARHNGVLPRKLGALVKIPGIARKSANVLLQELWGISEGIVVDTHVTRVANILGLTKQKDPVKIEQDLMKLIPKAYWRNFSGAVVLHGRYICIANKPKCYDCGLRLLCPVGSKLPTR